MLFERESLHCGKALLASLAKEIEEVESVLSIQQWAPDFSYPSKSTTLRNQAAYNKSLSTSLDELGWQLQPRLSHCPSLIGDFAKRLVFGEIQFGNSTTLYRDFYKFQYGLQNGLLSLAILVVPYDEYSFFPTRSASVKNMANFSLAKRYFTVLPISVPTIIYGLHSNGHKTSAEKTSTRAPQMLL